MNWRVKNKYGQWENAKKNRKREFQGFGGSEIIKMNLGIGYHMDMLRETENI